MKLHGAFSSLTFAATMGTSATANQDNDGSKSHGGLRGLIEETPEACQTNVFEGDVQECAKLHLDCGLDESTSLQSGSMDPNCLETAFHFFKKHQTQGETLPNWIDGLLSKQDALLACGSLESKKNEPLCGRSMTDFISTSDCFNDSTQASCAEIIDSTSGEEWWESVSYGFVPEKNCTLVGSGECRDSENRRRFELCDFSRPSHHHPVDQEECENIAKTMPEAIGYQATLNPLLPWQENNTCRIVVLPDTSECDNGIANCEVCETGRPETLTLKYDSTGGANSKYQPESKASFAVRECIQTMLFLLQLKDQHHLTLLMVMFLQ